MLHFNRVPGEAPSFADVFPPGRDLITLPGATLTADMLRLKIKDWYYPDHRKKVRVQAKDLHAKGVPLLVGFPLATLHYFPIPSVSGAGSAPDMRGFGIASTVTRLYKTDVWLETLFISEAALNELLATLTAQTAKLKARREGA